MLQAVRRAGPLGCATPRRTKNVFVVFKAEVGGRVQPLLRDQRAVVRDCRVDLGSEQAQVLILAAAQLPQPRFPLALRMLHHPAEARGFGLPSLALISQLLHELLARNLHGR